MSLDILWGVLCLISSVPLLIAVPIATAQAVDECDLPAARMGSGVFLSMVGGYLLFSDLAGALYRYLLNVLPQEPLTEITAFAVPLALIAMSMFGWFMAWLLIGEQVQERHASSKQSPGRLKARVTKSLEK
ncbi:hypothetical protein ACFOY8_14735 [Thalassospira xianhensis]|uniref:Uncharacterized protein n=1 Tax=Thalassospira xianhensis MCCC 1A02616 TaxID=1177929 RepID=A0A367UIW5_9PROT|nr:hypothetical protein [Thalassospira xianhensis]RCK07593.1 hypothetical protein TH5_00495 [Thalassospira xianhensis MCCC 1A02616]